MPTFEDPSNTMEDAFQAVRALDCHRERLAAVKIAVFSAHASRDDDDEPRGEALARNGVPILGKIRISSLEDRAEGMADVRVLLNGDRWGQLSAAMQRAVVDSCLTSIEVRQKDGAPLLDDEGRPKLQQRKWDFELVGFHEVAVRNGASSVEVHNFQVLFDEHGQTYLPLLAPDERPVNYLATAPKRTRTKAKEITKGSGSTHERGPLASAPLVARISHLTSPATILAVAKLELAKKPRGPVIKEIKARVLELAILPAFIRVEKGEDQQDPPLELDLDAAVLVTSPADLDISTLDRLVPECRDATVLGWILDDERAREEPRPEVAEVVERCLRELGATVVNAAPRPTPKSGNVPETVLRARIGKLDSSDTLLGIYILEVQRKKTRVRITNALRERATELDLGTLHADMTEVDGGGHKFTNMPDLAAGVLATSDDAVDDRTLDANVPECRDANVLRWVLEALADRDGLTDLVNERLAQLAAPQPGATIH